MIIDYAKPIPKVLLKSLFQDILIAKPRHSLIATAGCPQQGKFQIDDKTVTYPYRHDFVEPAYVARGTLRQQISGIGEVFYAGEFCLIDRDSLHIDYLNHDDSVVVFLSIEDFQPSPPFHIVIN